MKNHLDEVVREICSVSVTGAPKSKVRSILMEYEATLRKEQCKCAGKGYGTSFQRVTGSGDFEPAHFEKVQPFAVTFCKQKRCIRAEQLKKFFTIKTKYRPIYE